MRDYLGCIDWNDGEIHLDRSHCGMSDEITLKKS